MIAAQASENLGDKNQAREYAMRAKDTFAKLEQRWGSEDYKSYLSRPDIQRFRKRLEQLTGCPVGQAFLPGLGFVVNN